MKSNVRSLPLLILFVCTCSSLANSQSSTCAPFGTFTLSNQTYTVQNNEWNSTATECISATEPSSFTVTQSSLSNPTNNAPGGYPSIYKGCHWGNCTVNSGLPLQVNNIGSALSNWNTTQPAAGAYDVAYDVWFNQSPSTTGQPDGAELMIWLNSRGGVQPAGSQVGQATIKGAPYTVWTARMPSWNYIAYVSNNPTTAVADLDLRAFTNDAVTRNSISPAWYLIGVEAGFEIWQGGANLATNSFSFNITSGGSTGPTISAINPTSGASGSSVTISGSRFGTSQGSSSVNFGSTAAAVSSWSDNSISASVPNLPAGSVNVTVSADGIASNAAAFTVSGAGSSNVSISLQAISPNPSHVSTATNSTVNFTNQASSFASVTLVSELTDSGGNIIASQSQPANLAPQQTLAVTLTSFPAATGSYTVVGVVKDTSGAVLEQNAVGILTVN